MKTLKYSMVVSRSVDHVRPTCVILLRNIVLILINVKVNKLGTSYMDQDESEDENSHFHILTLPKQRV